MTYTDLLPILIALNCKPVIFSGQLSGILNLGNTGVVVLPKNTALLFCFYLTYSPAQGIYRAKPAFP